MALVQSIYRLDDEIYMQHAARADDYGIGTPFFIRAGPRRPRNLTPKNFESETVGSLFTCSTV